jgi:DNA-binding NtrC family response regulator
MENPVFGNTRKYAVAGTDDEFPPEPLVFMGMPAVIHSEAMRQLLRRVRKIAQTTAAVLITGESGSGKELVARAIHHYSLRCSRPWVDLNCGALPDHLLESELFGHEKGAFSGADSMKQGMFELAHCGTLFLDEIGELDQKMQVKLLRVLDGVPYYRLGGVRKTAVDVRILAATNQDLEHAVPAGKFRADLFHRLNQLRIEVPALRERMEDIEALALYFLEQHDPSLSFSQDALRLLRRYDWPGNVRELRNVVTKAALNAEEMEIRPPDLPAEISGERTLFSAAPSGPLTDFRLDGIEQQVIFRALAETGGRQDRAAQLLGISRRTLIRKLKLYESQVAAPGPVLCEA